MTSEGFQASEPAKEGMVVFFILHSMDFVFKMSHICGPENTEKYPHHLFHLIQLLTADLSKCLLYMYLSIQP